MISKEILVTRKGGLAHDSAASFIRTANEFQSQMRIQMEERSVNAKSLLDVLSMEITQGKTLMIIAEGADEAEAVAALRALLVE